MTAFAVLFALGSTSAPAAVVAQPAPVRLSDPTGDAITRELAACNLWRRGADLALTRDGDKLTARIFLPEHQQSDRLHGAREAQAVRHVLVSALILNGHVVRFSDHLWCEKGRKGWDVVAKATRREA